MGLKVSCTNEDKRAYLETALMINEDWLLEWIASFDKI